MLKLLIENKVDIDLKIKTKENYNWIDCLSQENRKKLLEDNIISPRTCGYIIKYLQEDQTVEMCQDAIDHDPDNIRFVREDLIRYFK